MDCTEAKELKDCAELNCKNLSHDDTYDERHPANDEASNDHADCLGGSNFSTVDRRLFRSLIGIQSNFLELKLTNENDKAKQIFST